MAVEVCGKSAERDSQCRLDERDLLTPQAGACVFSGGGEEDPAAAGGIAAIHTPNVALGRPEDNLPVILQLLESIILDLGR
jgi:hypothetical protein